jgi:hypothetical protein
MSLEEIEKVRKVSRAASNGPWVAWWGEMARKTVMRRLSKRLPMSTDLEDEIFSRDETLTVDGSALRQIESSNDAAPPVSRLDAIEQQIGGTAEPDPVVEEQADELEEQIEQSPEVNDQASPAEQTVAQFLERAKSATTAKQLAKIVAEAEPHKEAMPDELAVKLEVGFDRERVRIEAAAPVES